MAIHIKELNINTFRGIRDLEIKNLGDINIITGENNTGKTSVLEVLSTLPSPFELKTWLNLGNRVSFGEVSKYEDFNMIFNINNDDKNIIYSVVDSKNNYNKVSLEAYDQKIELTYDEIEKIDSFTFNNKIYEDNDALSNNKYVRTEEVNECEILFKLNDEILNKEKIYDFQRKIKYPKQKLKQLNKSVYISPVQHENSEMFLSNILNQPDMYEEMLNILKLFDDGIISINADSSKNKFSSKNVYKILSKNNKTAIPLNFYGDGIKKAILLLSAVIHAKDGILLLDEFEIAIHTSAMEKVFAWIVNACIKLNVQLFMTSHSEEAIDKVLKCSPEIQDKMRLITLYSNEDKIVSRVLDGKKAIKLKDDLGVELR